MDLDPRVVESNVELPDQMVVNGSDLGSGLHIRYGVTDAQMQAVLEIQGHVDEKRLTRAMRLSTIAEPILGCRFVKSSVRPVWQRRADLDSIEWCSVQVIGNKEEAIDLWLSRPLDLDFDPLVKACILRSSANDTLCIKIHHACCDGVAFSQYVSLLASIYNELSRDPAYRPQPNPADRDQSRMFLELGLISPSFRAPESYMAPFIQFLESCAAVIPFTPTEPKRRRQVIRRVPQWRDRFYSYKQRGITINDILLAAYWQALSQYVDSTTPEALKIAVAADLRPYLPADRTRTICNCFSEVYFHLNQKPNERLRDLVDEVSAVMKQFKTNKLGLQNITTFFEVMVRTPFDTLEKWYFDRKKIFLEYGKGFVRFTNIGLISKDKIYFDNLEVYDAYMVGQALSAPDFMLGVCTYQDWMTLSCAFFEPTIEAGWVERLLDSVVEALHSYREE